jgi:hypothetical protein
VPDDPIATLERELVAAAHRRARSAPPIALPPVRIRHRRGRAGAVAAVLLSTVALIVALGALVSLHARPAPVAKRPSPAVVHASSRQQLIDILGVLRRPQTPADLPHWLLARLTSLPLLAMQGRPDLPLVRYATTTPWGEKLYLVPYRPLTAAEMTARARRFPAGPPSTRERSETLGVMSRGGGGGGGDAATVEAGQVMQIDGAGRSFAGGSTRTRFILVVPDGVARVEFSFPPQTIAAGGPVYRRSLAVTVSVHGNIAAVQVNRECCAGLPALIWYGPAGRVLKRIGGMGSSPAPPQPGPETALSRAAEHDPSTPNRVWVTPSAGGPHTEFDVHFKVLLNDADYGYRLSGTSCPGITVNGGSGGGTNDVRGRVWSDVIDAVAGQTWCPGSYRISVTIMDRGRYGPVSHSVRPFGTATFTVTG